MAVVVRGHGGDAGGDPPPNPWKPPSHCQRPKVRGKSKGANLKEACENNGEKPLPIEFDISNQKTARLVGKHGSKFSNLVGSTVGNEIPKYYKSWKEVPDAFKAAIWPTIETYFDMRPHFRGPHANLIREGVIHLCSERYSDRKRAFKNKWFVDREGFDHPEEIRQFPPPNMSSAEWNKHVDYFLNDENIKRATINQANRRKQKYPSLHGSRSYAALRHEAQDPVTGKFPSLIDHFGNMHRRNNEYVNSVAQNEHSQAGSSNPMTEEQIISQVFGERRGRITVDGAESYPLLHLLQVTNQTKRKSVHAKRS